MSKKKKKKRPVQSQRTPKKSGSPPVHRRPLTASRASPPCRGGLERGAPAAPSLPAIAPEPLPPVLRRPPNAPGARHRISGNQGPHFPVSAHPQPHKGRNRRTFQKSNPPALPSLLPAAIFSSSHAAAALIHGPHRRRRVRRDEGLRRRRVAAAGLRAWTRP